MDKPLYTMGEVAELFGTNEAYVQNLRKSGLLKCLQLGRYKVRAEELERFLRENEGKDLRDPFNVKDIGIEKAPR